MILTPPELEQLTGRKRTDAQARELRHMGIPFRCRSDGTIVVLRIHVEHGQTQEKESTPSAVCL